MQTKTKKLNREVLGGVLLLLAAVAALWISNSRFVPIYRFVLDIPLIVQLGTATLNKPLLLWINDGLMTLFFFLIGLELKREFLTGHLRSFHQAVMPGVGALGGVLVPIFIFLWVTKNYPHYHSGWAIPMATDIAFSVAIISLFGRYIPSQLKIFLLTLAIFDDLAAIIVIAVFYMQHLDWLALIFASFFLFVLYLLNRAKVENIIIYFIVGFLLWLSVLESGVHATLCGVILAFFIPTKGDDNVPLSKLLEMHLQPVIAFFILPLFAFTNAGVVLQNIHWQSLTNPLTLGISMGLFIGKPIGITLFTLLYCALTRAKLQLTLFQTLAMGCVAGVGFTMSLFIASLGLGSDDALMNLSRLGILLGSLLSMCVGCVLIYLSCVHNRVIATAD